MLVGKRILGGGSQGDILSVCAVSNLLKDSFCIWKRSNNFFYINEIIFICRIICSIVARCFQLAKSIISIFSYGFFHAFNVGLTEKVHIGGLEGYDFVLTFNLELVWSWMQFRNSIKISGLSKKVVGPARYWAVFHCHIVIATDQPSIFL